MAGFRIEGNTSGNVAEVNASNQLKVTAETNVAANPGNVGSIRTFSENDSGSITGSAHLVSPETSQDYRLRIGQDTILFQDFFNATAQNTGLWKHGFSTMTMTQSAGYLNVNAAGTSQTSGHYAFLQSWRYFTLTATAPLCLEVDLKIDRQPVANEIFQIGWGVPTGAANVVDGVWLDLDVTNGLRGAVRFNSGTVTYATLGASTILSNDTTYKFFIIFGTGEIEFWINDVLYGSIPNPVANGAPVLSVGLPLFIQKYNAGAVASTPNMIVKISYLQVTLMDLGIVKPWSEQMAGSGLHAYQGQNGGTMGSLATYANNTTPTAALPVNTSLTANLPTGLGGQGIATVWNLANTDMVLLQWQNPTGGVAQTPRTLYITGVAIHACTSTAAWTAAAAGAHMFQWALGFGGTGVSAAQAEGASFSNNTTKAYRRKILGLMGQATGTAAIYTAMTNSIDRKFSTPVVVNPGEYVVVLCKMLNGAGTATGGLYYTIDFDGYFE